MDRLPVETHPDAAEEAEMAVEWYAERSIGAALRFVDELTAAVATIAEAPFRWPSRPDSTRRVLLNKFPYAVVYKVGEAEIEIVAIAHRKRRPGYWRPRLQ